MNYDDTLTDETGALTLEAVRPPRTPTSAYILCALVVALLVAMMLGAWQYATDEAQRDERAQLLANNTERTVSLIEDAIERIGAEQDREVCESHAMANTLGSLVNAVLAPNGSPEQRQAITELQAATDALNNLETTCPPVAIRNPELPPPAPPAEPPPFPGQ